MTLLLLAAALTLGATGARAQLSKDSALVPPVKSKAMDALDRRAMILEADRYRKEALRAASRKLSKLKGQLAAGAAPSSYDADTVKFVASWLDAKPGDKNYADTLTTAISAIVQNRALEPVYSVFPDSRKVCEDNDKAKGTKANAYNVKGGVFLCEPWLKGSDFCRRVVVIHEVFHTVGLVDLSAKLKFRARTTAQALTDAAYMAGLASQLNSGHEDGCP